MTNPELDTKQLGLRVLAALLALAAGVTAVLVAILLLKGALA
jgi:hypothetical protein